MPLTRRQIATLTILFSVAIVLNAWVARRQDLLECSARPVTAKCQQQLLK